MCVIEIMAAAYISKKVVEKCKCLKCKTNTEKNLNTSIQDSKDETNNSRQP